MVALKIELSQELKAHVERQAARAGFDDLSTYVKSLIERDREEEIASQEERFAELVRDEQGRQVWREASLEELIQKGLDSGPATPIDDDFWDQRHQALLRRYRERTHEACDSTPGKA